MATVFIPRASPDTSLADTIRFSAGCCCYLNNTIFVIYLGNVYAIFSPNTFEVTCSKTNIKKKRGSIKLLWKYLKDVHGAESVDAV